MPALIDHWEEQKALPPRERVVAVARWYMGTPYSRTKGRDARAPDGISGRALRTIDCSSLVTNVFAEVFPDSFGTNTRMNTTMLESTPLFRTLGASEKPQNADIIFWKG